ncbi:MAG: hypothetical protein Q8R40_01405 [bacterium]|nr:hypothetical protein [bacterium]
MPNSKEAKARIKINKLLEEAGWRFFDDKKGQANIFQTIIKALEIPFPSIETQKQLVAEAEKEEEIIAANRRLIELMEGKIGQVLSEI